MDQPHDTPNPDDILPEQTDPVQPAKIRADVALAKRYPQFSRSSLAKLFDKGLVTAAGKPIKANDKIAPDAPLAADISPLEMAPAAIDLPVVYEDADVVVINKPAGILTHAKGILSNEATVADFVRSRTTDGLDTNRPGIVHRLDRGTSGLIIAAKTPEAKRWLQKQFAERKVKKTYLALIEGTLREPHAIIDAPIERNPSRPQTFTVSATGKPAQTEYEVVEQLPHHALLRLRPKTGRTHQLRVHLKYLNRPIVGDELYGTGQPELGRTFLHATELELTLPSRERRVFSAPLPDDLQAYLKAKQ